MLLICWQEEHPTCKNTATTIPFCDSPDLEQLQENGPVIKPNVYLCVEQRKDEDYDDVVEENLLNEVLVITNTVIDTSGRLMNRHLLLPFDAIIGDGTNKYNLLCCVSG